MLKKITLRVLAVVVIAFVALVIIRIPYVREQNKTVEVVAKIHATKLTLDDVMGKNLPADPYFAKATQGKPGPDDTIAGVDANGNGIRDDVEIAIFKEYPNSAKTRAVLLQYALALQMEMTQPLVNTGTVTAVAQDSGRAHLCVGEITSRDDFNKFIETTENYYKFIEALQLNTKERKDAHYSFYNGNLDSYASPDNTCDLDLGKLLN